MAQASTAPAQASAERLMPVNTPKLGMWIFLASEVMFFSALIAAFMMFRLRGPADANHILNIPLTAFNSSMFGIIFFTLTGFHGLHVFIGLLWLVGIIVQALRGRFNADYSMSLEIFGLYWHFVDIVWIILFVIVYLI